MTNDVSLKQGSPIPVIDQELNPGTILSMDGDPTAGEMWTYYVDNDLSDAGENSLLPFDMAANSAARSAKKNETSHITPT